MEIVWCCLSTTYEVLDWRSAELERQKQYRPKILIENVITLFFLLYLIRVNLKIVNLAHGCYSRKEKVADMETPENFVAKIRIEKLEAAAHCFVCTFLQIANEKESSGEGKKMRLLLLQKQFFCLRATARCKRTS